MLFLVDVSYLAVGCAKGSKRLLHRQAYYKTEKAQNSYEINGERCRGYSRTFTSNITRNCMWRHSSKLKEKNTAVA
jgi:hypothetical protein